MRQVLPIFVLTLEDAHARRKPLVDRLASLGLEHEPFFGVDGRQGLPTEYEPLVDRAARVERVRRPMTDGEYACALSHLLLYRRIVESRIPRAIVLEDDAIVGKTLADFARGELHLPGALVLLDHGKGRFRRRGCVHVAPDLQAYRITLAPFLATGYALSRGAAQRLLDHGLPVRRLADWPDEICRMDSYAVHPRIVDHVDPEAGPSLLRDERDRSREARAGNPNSAWSRRFEPSHWIRRWKKRRHVKLDDTTRLDAVEDRSPSPSREFDIPELD